MNKSNAAAHTMHLALSIPSPIPHPATPSVDREIRNFLAGNNDGAGLLHALYDYVLDEEVPERLRALVKR